MIFFPQEKKSLLSLLCQLCCVHTQGQVLRDVNSQKTEVQSPPYDSYHGRGEISWFWHRGERSPGPRQRHKPFSPGPGPADLAPSRTAGHPPKSLSSMLSLASYPAATDNVPSSRGLWRRQSKSIGDAGCWDIFTGNALSFRLGRCSVLPGCQQPPQTCVCP